MLFRDILEARLMIILEFESEVDLGVQSNFAANASSALSVPWSSASGSVIFLKKASSLTSCSVQDCTMLCNLSFGSLLGRKFSARPFGV